MLSSLVIKAVYLALVIALLLPSVFASVVTIRSVRLSQRIQEDAQRGTSDTVYVTSHVHFGVGRFHVTLYPHMWAAISLLIGAALSLTALFFLFFVRQ